MFIEQSLFSIYRLFIKIPKLIYILGLLFTIFVAFTQMVYAYNINKAIDLSSTLLDYIVLKYEQKKLLNINSTSNDQDRFEVSGNNTVGNATDYEYTFLDDATFLHFREGEENVFEITLNESYIKNQSALPLVVLTKNEHLVYLKNPSQQYLKQHGITYDLIAIPPLTIEQPLFAYYFMEDMQKNEIMLRSLQFSILQLQKKIQNYQEAHNGTQKFAQLNQIYLNFYYKENGLIYANPINFSRNLSFKMVPSFIVKPIFSLQLLFLLYISSLLMGLFVRYVLISIFTAFLIIYDKFMRQNWGWVHQNLLILYRRYRSNRLGTLKIAFFYIIAAIGMPLLLTLGAYCILLKVIYPSLPLLINYYSDIFMKTAALVEIFHYLISRSRTTIKFFPIVSLLISFGVLITCGLMNTSNEMMLLNLNLTLQYLAFLVFALIEKTIVEYNGKGISGPYCPSYSRPRMMFYAGYDVSWEKELPPIFTYFTLWFDYSYFNDGEKCYIERDYQLLYGRMLGFNERRQVPEQDYELREMVPPLEEPSNEINLIQQ